MSVWLTIPSARLSAEADLILRLWRQRGYKVALYCEMRPSDSLPNEADYTELADSYPGYGAAVNFLIRLIMEREPDAEWFIAAGDDIEPDRQRTAQEIAEDCRNYFYHAWHVRGPVFESPHSFADDLKLLALFGVMQPTGDRWHEGVGGFSNAPIDRVCGSAWYGREYCRRMYGGMGPLWPGYQHMFVDEEAQEVALKMGVLWQRRDLIQKHNHWGRGPTDQSVLTTPAIPPHLLRWNSAEHWRESKELFQSRKASGFPGHDPIA